MFEECSQMALCMIMVKPRLKHGLIGNDLESKHGNIYIVTTIAINLDHTL